MLLYRRPFLIVARESLVPLKLRAVVIDVDKANSFLGRVSPLEDPRIKHFVVTERLDPILGIKQISITRVTRYYVVALQCTTQTLPDLVHSCLVYNLASDFKRFDEIMVDVHSWHSCDMNAQKAQIHV